MRWQAALFWGALSVTVLREPAMALRNSARGTITMFDDTEIVVTFGDRDQTGADQTVRSGFCHLHWGVLSLGPDGSAIWKFEVSSLTGTDRWQGQFVLYDKEDKVLGTVPSVGTFDVEVKEVRPRRMEIIMPLHFDAAVFERIGSAKMSMQCEPRGT